MQTKEPLGHILRLTVRLFRMRLMTKFKESYIPLSFEQFFILYQIKSNKAITQKELSDQLRKDKSIVLRQINILTDEGFINQTRNQMDKRKKHLHVTNRGLEILIKTKELGNEVNNELLNGVNDEEYRIFRKVLTKIQDNGNHFNSASSC